MGGEVNGMGHSRLNGRPSNGSKSRAAVVPSVSDCRRVKEECQVLRAKLAQTRKRRTRIQKLLHEEAMEVRVLLEQRHNELTKQRLCGLEAYISVSQHTNHAKIWLGHAQKWNVTNDCFHIWHRGPFATINGLRLGAEVPAPSCNAKDSAGLTFGISNNDGAMGGVRNNDAFKVSWVEINSALGLTTLLLASLEKKQPGCPIRFQHDLVPMGSTSKIGLRKSMGAAAATYYNLYSDDSFSLFGKRNFNMALNGLLKCLLDAAEAVEKRDRTIVLPHEIEQAGTNQSSELTIGKIPVTFGTDGEQWSRAMKYMLTDVKWLVAFVTKHVDR